MNILGRCPAGPHIPYHTSSGKLWLLFFPISSLLVKTMQGITWWLKYLARCHPCGRPSLDSWFLVLSYPNWGLRPFEAWTRRGKISHPPTSPFQMKKKNTTRTICFLGKQSSWSPVLGRYLVLAKFDQLCETTPSLRQTKKFLFGKKEYGGIQMLKDKIYFYLTVKLIIF